MKSHGKVEVTGPPGKFVIKQEENKDSATATITSKTLDKDAVVGVSKLPAASAISAAGTVPKKRRVGKQVLKCPWEGCERIYHCNTPLTEHINGVHKKIKPHKCPVVQCDYRTAQYCSIKKHVMKHHRDVWFRLIDGDN